MMMMMMMQLTMKTNHLGDSDYVGSVLAGMMSLRCRQQFDPFGLR